MVDQGCKACGRSDADRPMAFRGELYCSDLCRKALEAQPKPKTVDEQHRDECEDDDCTHSAHWCPKNEACVKEYGHDGECDLRGALP